MHAAHTLAVDGQAPRADSTARHISIFSGNSKSSGPMTIPTNTWISATSAGSRSAGEHLPLRDIAGDRHGCTDSDAACVLRGGQLMLTSAFGAACAVANRSCAGVAAGSSAVA